MSTESLSTEREEKSNEETGQTGGDIEKPSLGRSFLAYPNNSGHHWISTVTKEKCKQDYALPLLKDQCEKRSIGRERRDD